MNGIKRFKQAIKNQQEFEDGEFHLTYQDAEELADEIEDELARLSWAAGVPAPVDADGEVVPLRTEVMYDDDGVKHMVHSFTFVKEHNRWDTRCVQLRANMPVIHSLGLLHLHRPDSWKRLEEDVKQFENEVCACSYYGKKRLDCDGCKSPCQPGVNCRESVVGDVLRRAKALAERDAKGASPQPSPYEAKEGDRD